MPLLGAILMKLVYGTVYLSFETGWLMILRKERPDLMVMIGAMDVVAEVEEGEMLGEVCIRNFRCKYVSSCTVFSAFYVPIHS